MIMCMYISAPSLIMPCRKSDEVGGRQFSLAVPTRLMHIIVLPPPCPAPPPASCPPLHPTSPLTALGALPPAAQECLPSPSYLSSSPPLACLNRLM